MWWHPLIVRGKNVLLSCSSSLATVIEVGNGKHFYICDKAPHISFIWIPNCLCRAQGGCMLLPLTLPPPSPLPPPQASPATLAMRWQAGGCVAPFHTAVSLLIMTYIWCLFASRGIVRTLFHAHWGLPLASKKKKKKMKSAFRATLLESTTSPPKVLIWQRCREAGQVTA